MRYKSSLLGRLARRNDGVAALEFALVGPIFLAFCFSIFEASFFFFTTSTVEAASVNAARVIRTGEAKAGISKDEFADRICDIAKLIGDCDKALSVEITRYDSFNDLANDVSEPTCKDADDSAVSGLSYDIGDGRDIIRVRICYLFKSVSPGIGLDLAKTADGKSKIISTVIFRNEPF